MFKKFFKKDKVFRLLEQAQQIESQREEIFALREKLYLTESKIKFNSIADLTDSLIRAKDAHGQFERGLGRPDQNWPSWYAGFMAMEQGLAVSSSLIPRPPCSGPSCLVKSQTDAAGLTEGVGKSGPEEWDRGRQDYWNVH